LDLVRLAKVLLFFFGLLLALLFDLDRVVLVDEDVDGYVQMLHCVSKVFIHLLLSGSLLLEREWLVFNREVFNFAFLRGKFKLFDADFGKFCKDFSVLEVRLERAIFKLLK